MRGISGCRWDVVGHMSVKKRGEDEATYPVAIFV